MPLQNVLDPTKSKSFRLEDLFGGVSKAYLIGVSAYQNDIPPLSGPSKDIKLLAETFDSQGFETTSMLNEEASFDNIQNLFESGSISKLTEEDRLVIYFAGHGIAKNSDTVPKGYLLPWDANLEGDKLIAMDWLDEQLAKLKCRHILLVLDCCYAGAFQWSTGKRDVFQMVENVYVESLMRFTESPARQVITSAAYDQVAQDTAATSKLSIGDEKITLTSREFEGNSPFALALHEGLNEGKADSSGNTEAVAGVGMQDSIITATELFSYVRNRVHELTFGANSPTDQKRQSPAFFPLSKHDSKGEFVFFNQENIELQFAPDVNPYKVEEAYEEEDAKLFYGWSITELHSLSTEIQLSEGKIVLLLGEAKSGKTSLLQAGLLAYQKMKGKKLEAIDLLKNTLSSLEAEQEKAGILLLDHLDQAMYELNETGQRDLIAAIESLNNPKIVISLRPENLNSFRSLISESNQASVSKIYLKRLRLWKQEDEVLHHHPNEGEEVILEDDKSVIRKKLRDIALYSGRKSAVFLESEDLVGELVGELNQKNIRQKLSLLSRVLSSMYENYSRDFNRSDRVLRFQDFHQVGGIIGSLVKIADDFYKELLKEEPEKVSVLKKLLLRMVKFEEDNASQMEDSKGARDKLSSRIITQKDIVFTNDRDNEIIKDLLERLENKGLICRFLLEFDEHDEEGDIIGYQLVHPGLISQWRALRVWARRESFYLESIHDLEKPSADFHHKIADPEFPQNQTYRNQTEKFSQTSSVRAQFLQWLMLKRSNNFEGIWHDKVDIGNLYSMTELSQASSQSQTRSYQNRTNLFNQKEDEFIRFSYALRERKKKNIRFWRYTLLGSLGVVILIIGSLWFRAVQNKNEAERNERKAIKAQQREEIAKNTAQERLRVLLYKEHLEVMNRAKTFIALGKKEYACSDYYGVKKELERIEQDYELDALIDDKGNRHSIETLYRDIVKKLDNCKEDSQ